MGPSLAVEGSTAAEVFEAYLEHVLLPELQKGQVVVMDSLPAHKPKRGEGTDRKARLPAFVPAQLLPRVQSS
jgi:transposase